MKKHTIFILFIISVALVIGFWRDGSTPSTSSNSLFYNGPPLSAGTAFSQPKALPAFNLQDMEERPFTNESLKQHWSFLFFGYASCPQVCPVTLSALKQIAQRVHGGDLVQYIFITLNPQKDTTTTLKHFLEQAQFKSTSFLGVTGQQDHIYALAKALHIHIAEAQNREVASEDFEHSGTILLINPRGELAAIFTAVDKPHAISHDFKEIVHYHSQQVRRQA